MNIVLPGFSVRLKQLRSESYIPAGNVETTYGNYNNSSGFTERHSPVVSDGSDEDDDDDYRPKKKKKQQQQQRRVYSSEEESEEEYRPKRKSKKASV